MLSGLFSTNAVVMNNVFRLLKEEKLSNEEFNKDKNI